MTASEEPTSEKAEPDLPEREILAAEYVLGLLNTEAILTARGRIAGEPDFAAEVANWEDRFAPLLDEIHPAKPNIEIWTRIQAALDKDRLPVDNVVEFTALRRSLRSWKIATGSSAAAAMVLAFLALPSVRKPEPDISSDQQLAQQLALAEPLVASIPIADTQLRLGVTYLPDRREMLVSASGLTADGVHDHELWMMTPNDVPKSLGVVVPGEERRMTVDKTLAQHLHNGSALLLTREPLGGADPNGAAGPVVANGSLQET